MLDFGNLFEKFLIFYRSFLFSFGVVFVVILSTFFSHSVLPKCDVWLRIFASFFVLPKYVFLDIFLSIHAGSGVGCTRNVFQFNFWQFYLFRFSFNADEHVPSISNASNGVSWCTRLVCSSTAQHEKWQSTDCFVCNCWELWGNKSNIGKRITG